MVRDVSAQNITDPASTVSAITKSTLTRLRSGGCELMWLEADVGFSKKRFAAITEMGVQGFNGDLAFFNAFRQWALLARSMHERQQGGRCARPSIPLVLVFPDVVVGGLTDSPIQLGKPRFTGRQCGELAPRTLCIAELIIARRHNG